MSALPARLGSLEAQVMDVLWDHGPRTIRQIIDELPAHPAYTTIATVLKNLQRKEYVEARHTGRSVQFAPSCSRAAHCADLMEYALSTSCNPADSIRRFVDAMGAEDRALLAAYLTGGHFPEP